MDLTTLSFADLHALSLLLDNTLAKDCEYWDKIRPNHFYKRDNLRYEIAVEWTRRFAEIELNPVTPKRTLYEHNEQ